MRMTFVVVMVTALTLTTALGRGQPVEDLGTLSRRSPITFHLPASFNHGSDILSLRFFTASGAPTTSHLTLTNGLLLLGQVPAQVEGEMVVEVRVVAGDGEESEPRVYKVRVRRRVEPVGGGEVVRLRTEEEERAGSLEELRFVRRRAAALMNPAPAPAGAVVGVVVPAPPPALPGATNQSYREFLGRVEATSGGSGGRRRSE